MKLEKELQDKRVLLRQCQQQMKEFERLQKMRDQVIDQLERENGKIKEKLAELGDSEKQRKERKMQRRLRKEQENEFKSNYAIGYAQQISEKIVREKLE